MASVLITFDGGNVPVLVGDVPPDPQTPIADPVATGYSTNKPFIVDQNVYCYCIQTNIPHTPLWRTVQAIDGVESKIAFRKTAA